MSFGSYGYRRRSQYGRLILAGMVAFVIVVGMVAYNAVFYTTHTATITVCSKERAASSGGGQYRVYTANNGTFVIKDMHWFGHWRTTSADTYGQLHPPGTFDISYVGRRFGLFSWFPNITSFKRVATNKSQLAECSN